MSFEEIEKEWRKQLQIRINVQRAFQDQYRRLMKTFLEAEKYK